MALGVYNSDGTIRYTLVEPDDTPFGLYAQDGSLRFVNATVDGGFGIYAPNGAYRVNPVVTGRLYDESGAFTLWGLNNGKATTADWLVLDPFDTEVFAAYSMRLLRSDRYDDPCIRVRRASDNVERDIGFREGWLDTTLLTSFIGSSSGFVVTWYDQSGTGKDVTQATTANQWRIVNAGVLESIPGPELVVNGDFSAAGAGWTGSAGVSFPGGRALFSGVVAEAGLQQALSLPAGKTYAVTYSVQTYTQGQHRVLLGTAHNAGVAGAAHSGGGTFTDYIATTTVSDLFLQVTGPATGSFFVDNISVRELSQSSRPCGLATAVAQRYTRLVNWSSTALSAQLVINCASQTGYPRLFGINDGNQTTGLAYSPWLDSFADSGWLVGDAAVWGRGYLGQQARLILTTPGLMDGSIHQHDIRMSSAGAHLRIDGVAKTARSSVPNTIPSITGGTLSIGSGSGSNGTLGRHCEHILWAADIDDTLRNAIRADQKAVWDTP